MVIQRNLTEEDIEWIRMLSERHGIPLSDMIEMYKQHGYDRARLLDTISSNTSSQYEPFNRSTQNTNDCHICNTDNRSVHGMEHLPKVTVFLNGILIRDVFYDIKHETGRRLVGMLERNEFDRDTFEEAFGRSEAFTDLIVERRNDFYDASMDMTDLKKNIHRIDEEDTSKRLKKGNSTEQAGRFKYVIGKGIVPMTRMIPRQAIGSECDLLPMKLEIGANPTVKFKLVHNNKECVVLCDSSVKICEIARLFPVKVYFSVSNEILDENKCVESLKNTVVDLNYLFTG